MQKASKDIISEVEADIMENKVGPTKKLIFKISLLRTIDLE